MPGKSIAIVSGKGGVGKTTVTANVGAVLAKDYSDNVVVLDANVLTSNLGLQLGLIHTPMTLHEISRSRLSLDKAVYVHSSGLKVIPSSLSLDEKFPAALITKAIKKLVTEYSTVLVDSAPGLSKEALAVMQGCERVLVVTNPEIPAVTDAIKTIDCATQKYKKYVIGVVLNKVTGAKYELSKEEIERILGQPVIAVIPNDQIVAEAIAAKTPVVMYAPNSAPAIAIKQLAARIAEKPYAGPTASSDQVSFIRRFLNKLFG